MSYTVVFNTNGGDDSEITTLSQSFTVNVTQALMKRPGSFYRTGYKFIGWGTTTFSTVATYQDEEVVLNLAEDGQTITLYAIWRPESIQDILMGISSSLPIYGGRSLSPAPAVSKDQLFDTMGWTCDRASVVYSSGTILGYSKDLSKLRTFYKRHDGFAICAFKTGPSYNGPALFSTSLDAATYEVIQNGVYTTVPPAATVSYLGKTWYVNTEWHGNSRPSDANYPLHAAAFTIADNDAGRAGVLTALGVRNTPYSSSSNFYKGFEIGKALVNPTPGS